MPVTTASSKSYFVLHDGVDEVTRAVADSKPDQRGLQELLLRTQCPENLVYFDVIFGLGIS